MSISVRVATQTVMTRRIVNTGRFQWRDQQARRHAWRVSRSCRSHAFLRTHGTSHRRLALKTLQVAENGCGGQCFSIAPIAQETIASLDIALDVDLIPPFRMADVIDRHVVVLAPEERHLRKRLASAKHVA